VSYNNCWTICSSYDFQAHLPDSRRTCSIPGVPAAFQAHLLHSRRACSIPGAPEPFQALLQHSQRRWFSLTALVWFEVLPALSKALRELSPALPDLLPALLGAPKVLSGTPRCSQTYHNHSHGTPVPVIGDLNYSEGPPECPPTVWYSSEIDASKFTLHILSDTSGVFQRLKYILLMSTQNPPWKCRPLTT